ncbi:Peptidoglycan-binding LysM [Alkaliphilus metalliredigens QYMF]|uniref:Peptidoglycan-binding LysM n=1 Tax=Alkaliphilus metalliredigens (strain QYMF) TaxID=293826 RepID=A6TVJ7_ALKMQ|nr:LysM peptidoglycan-binding domain-containing protein [Alkaliphilus metalliredigens]ABR50215.1 Peptidoglycan-binding LysM [Alkaliphilus metalliredigens QYMF]
MASKIKKIVVGTVIASTVLTTSILSVSAASMVHTVVSGDTLWKISQRYNVTLEEVYQANLGYRAQSMLMVGARVSVPEKAPSQAHTVQKGDTPWTISNQFGVNLNELLQVNGLRAGDEIYPGQRITIPKGQTATMPVPPTRGTQVKRTTRTHTVASGDNTWSLSIKYGIPFAELLKVNGMTENSTLRIGQKITIPVYHIPVKSTPGSQYGELLDWWTEAQYVVPIGATFKMTDYYTGKSWMMKRTIGANHADSEPVTAADAAIMKQVWGGSYSWSTRPMIVEINGRRIAASASSMPHDIQYIKNNSFNGHMDVYFHNSTRHKDGKPDLNHQRNVIITAGKS